MKCFLDTSVLLPAALSVHPNHVYAVNLIETSAAVSAELICLSTHVIAELYSNLPTAARRLDTIITAEEAAYAVKSLVNHFTTISLDEVDYFNALDRCAQLNLTGGVVYDAIHYQAALKAEVDILYTDNLKDFTRLVLPGDSIRIEGLDKY